MSEHSLHVLLLKLFIAASVLTSAAASFASDAGGDVDVDVNEAGQTNPFEDLLELQHIVEFVDPEHGFCPTFHPADEFFDSETIAEEYSVEQLELLQQEYLAHLPALKAVWEREGAPALETILSDADDRSDSLGTAAVGREDSGRVRIQVNGVDIDFHADDFGSGGSINFVLDGQFISLPANGILNADILSTLGVSTTTEDLDEKTSRRTFDVESIVREQARKKYLSDIASEQTTGAVRKSSPTAPADFDSIHQRNVDEYNAANCQWMQCQNSVATPTSSASNTDRHLGSASDPTCSRLGVVSAVLRMIRADNAVSSCAPRRLSALQYAARELSIISCADADHARVMLAELQSGECVTESESGELDDTLCTAVADVAGRYDPEFFGQRFTAVLDILLPVLNASSLPHTGSQDPEMRFVRMIESGALQACLGRKLTAGGTAVDSALLGELWYASFIAQAAIKFSQPHRTDVTSAAAVLALQTAVKLGSVNAVLAHSTLSEHRVLVDENCWRSVDALLPVVLRAQRTMFEQLEIAYAANGADQLQVHERLAGIRAASRFLRAPYAYKTLAHDVTSTETRQSSEQTLVFFREKFLSSASTHTSFVFLRLIGQQFWAALHSRQWTAGGHASTMSHPTSLKCWSWAILGRFHPQVVKAHFSSYVSPLCPATSGVDFSELVEARPVDPGTWLRRCLEDVNYYVASVQVLKVVAAQTLFDPLPSASVESVKELVLELLDLAENLSSLLCEDAVRRHRKTSANEGMPSENEMTSWHHSLIQLAVHAAEKRADGLRHATGVDVVSAGLVSPDMYYLRGLVLHLAGRPLDAVRSLVQGAGMELRKLDSDSIHLVVAATLESTTGIMFYSRGDCLCLLASLVSKNETLFWQWRALVPLVHPTLDVPGVSVTAFDSMEEFATALREAAAAPPLRHAHSIMEIFEKKRDDAAHQSQAADQEAPREDECVAMLADVRNVLGVTHESRQLDVVKWLSDWQSQRDSAPLFDTLSEWIERGWYWLEGLVGGDGAYPLPFRPPWQRMRQQGRLGDLTSRIPDAHQAAGDKLVAVEWLHFVLLQNCPDAFAALIALGGEIDEPARGASWLAGVSGAWRTLFAQRSSVVFDEETVRAHQRKAASNAHPEEVAERPSSMDVASPFLYASTESRLRLSSTASLHEGLSHWSAANRMLFSRMNTSRGVQRGGMWKSPGGGTSVLEVWQVRDSATSRVFAEWAARIASQPADASWDPDDLVIVQEFASAGKWLGLCGSSDPTWLEELRRQAGDSTVETLMHIISDASALYPPLISPRCLLELALLVDAVGLHTLDLGAQDDVPTLPPAAFASMMLRGSHFDHVSRSLIAGSKAAAERLSEFHLLSKTNGENADENSVGFASDDDDDEDDPDDTRLQEPSLEGFRKAHAVEKIANHSHQPVSSHPVAHLLDVQRDLGEGRSLFEQRLDIAGAWYAASWLELVGTLRRWFV